jgi:hypothetical protein
MSTAYGLGIAAWLLLVPGAGQPVGPDRGTPFPPALAVAYVYNNTVETIRWLICSPTGVVGGDLDPGTYGKFSFEYVHRPRTLSVFSDTAVISCREVELYPGNYYFASPEVGPVVQPGPWVQPKVQAPFKVDKGMKQVPKGAKEGRPPKKGLQGRP